MPRIVENDGAFSDVEPEAIIDYTIDFSRDVPAGVTIASAPWELAVRYVAPGYTADPTPASRLLSDPRVVGLASIQQIGNLVTGNTYLVTSTATLSDGEVVPLWCTLTCVPRA